MSYVNGGFPSEEMPIQQQQYAALFDNLSQAVPVADSALDLSLLQPRYDSLMEPMLGQPLCHAAPMQMAQHGNPMMMMPAPLPAGGFAPFQFQGSPSCQYCMGGKCGKGQEICEQIRKDFSTVYDSLINTRRRFERFSNHQKVMVFLGKPYQYAEKRRQGVFGAPAVPAAIRERDNVPEHAIAPSLGLADFAHMFQEDWANPPPAKRQKGMADDNLEPQAAPAPLAFGAPYQGDAAMQQIYPLLATGDQQGNNFQPDINFMASAPFQGNASNNLWDLPNDPTQFGLDGNFSAVQNFEVNLDPAGNGLMNLPLSPMPLGAGGDLNVGQNFQEDWGFVDNNSMNLPNLPINLEDGANLNGAHNIQGDLEPLGDVPLNLPAEDEPLQYDGLAQVEGNADFPDFSPPEDFDFAKFIEDYPKAFEEPLLDQVNEASQDLEGNLLDSEAEIPVADEVNQDEDDSGLEEVMIGLIEKSLAEKESSEEKIPVVDKVNQDEGDSDLEETMRNLFEESSEREESSGEEESSEEED